MGVTITAFAGASMHCPSAAVVAAIDADVDLSRFCLVADIPSFSSASKYLKNSRRDFPPLGGPDGCTLGASSLLEAWAGLCALAGCDVFAHGGRREGQTEHLFVSCTDNDVAKAAVIYLLKTAQSGGATGGFSEQGLAEFIAALQPYVPETSTKHLVAAAKELGIPVVRLFPPHLIAVGAGKNSVLFNRQAPGDDGHHGTLISRDKHQSKQFFAKLGLPVASSLLIDPSQAIGDLAAKLMFPCVVKPIDGSQGTGVYVNLKNKTDVERAVQKSARTSNLPLMVEQQVHGDDVRLLVCRGELLIAVKRAKPFVVGDGTHSIAELVHIENIRRADRDKAEKRMPEISMDEEACDYLLTLGFSLQHIPEAGQKIEVRGTPHGTHGGAMEDVTREVHPEIISLAVLASERIGGALCGLDYISSDHTMSPLKSGGVFLEINTFPGLKPLELLSRSSQLESMKKIFGKAAIPLEVKVLLGPSPWDFKCLEKLISGSQTAWYCGGRVGLGPPCDEPSSAVISAATAFDRLLLDSRADRLIFLLTSDEFKSHGLPSERIQSIVVVDPSHVSQRVREALRSVATTYEEMPSL